MHCGHFVLNTNLPSNRSKSHLIELRTGGHSSMNLKCINILFPYSCSSLIGHHEDPQTITLGAGCQFRGTIAHEIMHLLGFFHEHTRQDRDQYITVYEDNILDGMLLLLKR